MSEGNCRHVAPETMFPSDSAGVRRARQICASCQVKQTCLEFALANRLDQGVWGATSERERRRLIRQRCTPNPSLTKASSLSGRRVESHK
jgi:WhiB family transcriptional regulator, redox-sensing transcriptional regulator